MRVRPLGVFSLIATAMVLWLSVRMWVGDSVAVWRVSCVMGAWAPLGAAVVYQYIRAVGGREDSVLAAWLVRAIGMHCVLVWLLGINDWLRGPPDGPPAWNTDTGMPLVLLLFAPAFGLCTLAVRWVMRLSARLDPPAVPTLHAVPAAAGAAPYRGTAMRAVGGPGRRPSVIPFAVGALACAAAASGAVPAPWVVGSAVVGLALVTGRGMRALGAAVPALVTVVGLVMARDTDVGGRTAVFLAVMWPWISLAVVGAYLATVEAGLRVRDIPARVRVGAG